MKKEDLKFGMIVELRKGVKCLIHPVKNYSYVYEEGIKDYLIDHLPEDIYFRNLLNGKLETHLGCLTNDLRENSGISNYDIIKIYKDYTLKEVLWERKKVPQLSDEAISMLKFLPKKWKYIARDKDNSDDALWVYNHQPCMEREKNGSVHFKPNPILEYEWFLLNTFLGYFECFPKGECYLIEDLIKGE